MASYESIAEQKLHMFRGKYANSICSCSLVAADVLEVFLAVARKVEAATESLSVRVVDAAVLLLLCVKCVRLSSSASFFIAIILSLYDIYWISVYISWLFSAPFCL